MKKIARISKDCFFENDTFTDTIIVRKSDLDAQEAYIERLEEERDDFKNKLSAMTAHRNALKEEISGLHKYINKLHTELNKPPLFKNQPPQEKE